MPLAARIRCDAIPALMPRSLMRIASDALIPTKKSQRPIAPTAYDRVKASRKTRGHGQIGPSLIRMDRTTDSPRQTLRPNTTIVKIVVTSSDIANSPVGVTLIVDPDVPRLRRDAGNPRSDRRVSCQVEIPLLGDVRVRVERDVGDRVAILDEERMRREVALHRVQGAVSAGLLD